METDYRGIKGILAEICISVAVVVIYLYVLFKMYKTVHFNRENFTVWKLYLNRPDF